jgi:hypothetical protein
MLAIFRDLIRYNIEFAIACCWWGWSWCSRC